MIATNDDDLYLNHQKIQYMGMRNPTIDLRI